MASMLSRGLIAGLVASTAIALSGQVGAQTRTTDSTAGGAEPGNSAVSVKQVRQVLIEQLSAVGVLKKGTNNEKASGAIARLVNDLSDERVMGLAGMSAAQVSTALFGSQAANDLLQSAILKGTSTAGIVKLLGDSAADLVYTPLTPCRIVDTRFWAAGALTAGVDRAFDIETADINTQTGGNVTGGCGIPTNARALSANITVIGAGTGFLTVWQDTATQPNASIANWSPATGGPIPNAAVIPIFPVNPAAHMLSSAGTTGTHVIIDAMGYFAPPAANTSACTNVAMTSSASTTGLRSISVACPAGRVVTGGSCDTSSSAAGGITGFSQSVVANGFWCESNNYTGNTTPFVLSGSARCCVIH